MFNFQYVYLKWPNLEFNALKRYDLNLTSGLSVQPLAFCAVIVRLEHYM